MLKESSEQLSGNERFEGFVFDVIDEISKMLGFNYTFKIVDDGNYGTLKPVYDNQTMNYTKQWNGMIRELLDGVSSRLNRRTARKWLFMSSDNVFFSLLRKLIWPLPIYPSIMREKKQSILRCPS